MRSPKKSLIDTPAAQADAQPVAPVRNPREPWPPRLPNGRRPARLPEDDAPAPPTQSPSSAPLPAGQRAEAPLSKEQE